jgi:small subunit ribosomal protein S4
MAKYTDAKCKLCRREGQKLYLKGARCLSDKCAINRRNTPPGQHGKSSRGFGSDFMRQLREKQKAKKIYGLLEGQFRNYVEEASRKRGITGLVLLQLLERRLDNVLYLSGISLSRNHGRQLIRQKKVKVNGEMVDIPSYLLNSGDEVSHIAVETTPKEESQLPAWIKWDKTTKSLKVEKMPSRDEIQTDINEQLIVEYYSR